MVAEPRGRKAIARLGVKIAVGALVTVGVAAGAVFAARGLLPEGDRTTLTVALPTFGAEQLDPSADGQAAQAYYGHMYDRLLGAGPDGRLSAGTGALEAWSSGADGRSHILTLRQGMKWHDSVEVTSDDVRFSLEHYKRQGAACSVCGHVYEAVEEVQILDRYRVRVVLREPDFAFIARLGPEQEDIPLLPSHYWREVGEAGFADKPIGSGPWKFVERMPGEFIEYEANLDYWDTGRIPGFQRLRLLKVREREERLAMLRTGAVDMAPVAPGDIEPLKAEGFSIQGPRFVIETALRFFMSYDTEYLTGRLEFRKALVLGMNLSAIVEKVYPPEAATRAGGSAMFSPLTEGYDPDLPPYPYDPEAARQLLDELGYDGETVYLMSIAIYETTEMLRKDQEGPLVSEMIADDWRRIGLNVEIVPTGYGAVKARYFMRRPQLFRDYFPAPVFHGGHLNRPGGIMNAIQRYLTQSDRQVLLGYHDLQKGDSIYFDLIAMPDAEERRRRLTELNRELYEEYWAAPIVWRHEVWALRPELSGWRPTNGTPSDLHFETIQPR